MVGNPEDDNFDFWVPGNEDRNELEESENESIGESVDKNRELAVFKVRITLPVHFRGQL